MKSAKKRQSGNSLTIQDIVSRRAPPVPWEEGDNIPWNEPEFSRRMLAEHLSQEHDLASRRTSIIDTHVDFIHRTIGAERQARVIDLACGPGLYLHRLARLGHSGLGIDFSPASIEHAKQVAAQERLDCTFLCADLRQTRFDGEFDACLLVFGQVNVFTREQAHDILTRAYHCLTPGAVLFLEPQHPSVLRGDGETRTDWSAKDHGLFFESPHLVLHERWRDEPSRTATDRWYVVEAESSAVQHYALSTCSYEPTELQEQLRSIGFRNVAMHPSLTGNAGDDEGPLFALVATK